MKNSVYYFFRSSLERRAMKLFLLFSGTIIITTLTSCTTPKAKTLAESQFGPSYGYVPVDPLPVHYRLKGTSYDYVGGVDPKTLLNLLPDETMRLVIGQVQTEGNITYGVAKLGTKGNNYTVVLDYVKFTAIGMDVDLVESEGRKTVRFKEQEPGKEQVPGQVVMPVYIGVGLRLSANVKVNEGEVDLGNLIAIGAAAKAKKVSGTMVIQTLGISGEAVSSLLPMPSEINESTIQAAIIALASIKAKIYTSIEASKVTITPRVLAFYNNLGADKDALNSFISALFKKGAYLELPSSYK